MKVPAITPHEREGIAKRLDQIARELEFPNLRPTQSTALHLERTTLQTKLAREAIDGVPCRSIEEGRI
jgi:hypothetical protein